MKEILLLASIFYWFFISVSHADTITLVADDWCPINCEPSSDSPGYVVELAIKIFSDAGHQVKYQYLSWNRALAQVRAGKFNGAIAATPEELPEGIFPIEELGYYGNYFIQNKGSEWHYTSVDSLAEVDLAVIQGYNYGENLNEYIKANPTKITDMGGNDVVRRNLGMLMKGRVDVYLEDRNIAFYTAKNMGILDEIEVAGTEGTPIALYIGFSPAIKQSKQYAQILSEGMRRLRKNGQLKKILDKYSVLDWK